MSNKTDTVKMKQTVKRELKPKLRFPEFKNAPKWYIETLDKNISLEYGRPLSEAERTGGSVAVVGSNGIVGYHNDSLVRGPVIIIGRKGSAGQVNWIDGDCYPIDTTFYVKIKNSDKTELFFLHLSLQRLNLENLRSNSNVPGINRNDIYSIKITFPKLPEQKKIADCFSSVDDLITAQIQKIEMLKAHKKGLMQQLFPAEGETLPKLRFPEFKNAPEWEEKRLDEMADIIGGGTPDVTIKAYWNDGIAWFTPSEITQKYLGKSQRTISELGLRNSSAKILPVGALLLSTRATIGEVGIATEICTTNQGFQSLIAKKSNEFLYYWIKSHKNEFLRRASGSTFLEINKSEVSKIVLYSPSLLEQQKIADCLSSIDELITAQAQKLETLKAHKKGLMQQLFPAFDEVGK